MKIRKADAEKNEYEILGQSKHIKDILRSATEAAKDDTAVLIAGPTGTGKELIARHIHNESSRHKASFETMDCGAISPQLFESELFGHEKGAFTGANAQRIGRAENAKGGSLFLDEIGNLSQDHQSKILRFLNDKTFTKVGGNKVEKADVRIITATNKDLKAGDGGFRFDLYHRISEYVIRTIGLADRPEDTVYLLNHFNHEADTRAKFLLYSYSFPGNVRELKNHSNRSFDYLKTELAGEMDNCILYVGQHNDMDFDKIVQAYEIVILRANTAMSNKAIVDLLHIRADKLSENGFYENFSIVLPDKDDSYIKTFKTLYGDFLGYWNALKLDLHKPHSLGDVVPYDMKIFRERTEELRRELTK
ncbi:MAG: sigma 54-interacting transcriptional regulator [Syntrophus sp. (in: bacteria)]